MRCDGVCVLASSVPTLMRLTALKSRSLPSVPIAMMIEPLARVDMYDLMVSSTELCRLRSSQRTRAPAIPTSQRRELSMVFHLNTLFALLAASSLKESHSVDAPSSGLYLNAVS